MNACELDVGFGRVGDNQAVDDALGDGLRDSMTEQTLDLNTGRVGRTRIELGWVVVKDIRECSVSEDVQRCGGCTYDVRGPSVNLPLQG